MSITFACKRIRRKDLIKCAFDINKTSYNILSLLMKETKPSAAGKESYEKEKKLTVSEVANKSGLKRSSVQKALKELMKKELIHRSQMNLKNGGYIYFYYSIGREKIKQKISTLLEEWHENAKKEINKL